MESLHSLFMSNEYRQVKPFSKFIFTILFEEISKIVPAETLRDVQTKLFCYIRSYYLISACDYFFDYKRFEQMKSCNKNYF